MIENFSHSTQSYTDQTSMVLRTELVSKSGSSVEILDFAPRFKLFGRNFKGAMLLRRIKPLLGDPLICVRCRPTFDYNTIYPDISSGSNHIRYIGSSQTLRITTDIPISYIFKETTIVLDEPKHMVIGSDESLTKGIIELFDTFIQNTQAHWKTFSHSLTLPLDWQPEVMRSAMILHSLCYEDTGVIVSACTSGVPGVSRSPGLDGRLSMLKNAAVLARAMCRLNMNTALDQYLRALYNIVVKAVKGKQPLPTAVTVQLEKTTPEEEVKYLAGFKGIGSVKIGAPAWLQACHNEVYGSVIYALSLAFFDCRLGLHERADERLFTNLEELGHVAFSVYGNPGFSSFLSPTSQDDLHIHTVAVLYCWLACEQLRKAALTLTERGLDMSTKAAEWETCAATIETYINTQCCKDGVYTTFAVTDTHEYGSKPHPCLLLMQLFGFAQRNPEQFGRTVETLGNSELLKVNTAYLFWLVEVKAVNHRDEAKELFLSLLRCRTMGGLLSAYIDLNDHTLWGNLPDAQSTAAMISAAFAVSREWTDVL